MAEDEEEAPSAPVAAEPVPALAPLTSDTKRTWDGSTREGLVIVKEVGSLAFLGLVSTAAAGFSCRQKK
jgi:hypothetical protein